MSFFNLVPISQCHVSVMYHKNWDLSVLPNCSGRQDVKRLARIVNECRLGSTQVI